jgi:hypothetical protein
MISHSFAHGAAGDLALLPVCESAEPIRSERSEVGMGPGPLGVQSLVGDRADGPVKWLESRTCAINPAHSLRWSHPWA